MCGIAMFYIQAARLQDESTLGITWRKSRSSLGMFGLRDFE